MLDPLVYVSPGSGGKLVNSIYVNIFNISAVAEAEQLSTPALVFVKFKNQQFIVRLNSCRNNY